MDQQKQQWDTRAWLIALLGGGFSAAVCGVCSSPWAATRLDAAFPNGDDWTVGLFGTLSLLLLPALLSGIARRYPFLWGLLSPLFFFVGITPEDARDNGWHSVRSTFWILLAALVISWVISSGPVSLFRWLRVRARRRREAHRALIAAQRRAASVPQEGVWPPPPAGPHVL